MVFPAKLSPSPSSRTPNPCRRPTLHLAPPLVPEMSRRRSHRRWSTMALVGSSSCTELARTRLANVAAAMCPASESPAHTPRRRTRRPGRRRGCLGLRLRVHVEASGRLRLRRWGWIPRLLESLVVGAPAAYRWGSPPPSPPRRARRDLHTRRQAKARPFLSPAVTAPVHRCACLVDTSGQRETT